MISFKKAAAALCLSGVVMGGTATTAFAATASTPQSGSSAQAFQVVGKLCGYQVVRAPNGLYVRTGPSTMYRVVGGLMNGQHTTGDCAAVRGWIHLSNKYNH